MEGSWVHAYPHRKEGDQGNAAYWYSRAGKAVCHESLDAEWISIVKALLHKPTRRLAELRHVSPKANRLAPPCSEFRRSVSPYGLSLAFVVNRRGRVAP